MTWYPYALSLLAGLGVGVLYGLISVRSPAPPIIALLGLLGMLAGEAAVQMIRGHATAIAEALHLKSFATHDQRGPSAPKDETPSKPL